MTIVVDHAYISRLTLKEVKQKLEEEIELQDENIHHIDITIAQDIPTVFYKGIRTFIARRCYQYYATELNKPDLTTLKPPRYSPDFLFYIAHHLLYTLPDPNYQDIAQLFRKAAKKRHVDAIYNMGALYEKGHLSDDGTPNYKKAFKWYRTAYREHHAEAMCNIGLLYEQGHLNDGTPDYEKAKKYYCKAWDLGFFPAAYHIGLLYEEGHFNDGTPNYDEALKWYITKPGERRPPHTIYHLGFLHEQGHLNNGTPDYQQALGCYSCAAREGHYDALAAYIKTTRLHRPNQADLVLDLSKHFFGRHIDSDDYTYKQEAFNAFCAEVASFATHTYPEGRDIFTDQHRAAFGHILIESVAGKNESYLSYDQQIDLGSIEGGREVFIDCLQKGFDVYWQEHHPVDQETEPPVLELSPDNLSIASIAQAVNDLIETQASISSNVQHQAAIADMHTSSVSRG